MRGPNYHSRFFAEGRDEPASLPVRLRRLARTLWVCRASTASVAAGFACNFLGPVHDLFLDVGDLSRTMPLVGRAFVFAFLTTVFWAAPVHAVARLAVDDADWLKSPFARAQAPEIDAAAGRFDILSRWTPRALGLACYAVAAAIAATTWAKLPIETGTALAQACRRAIIADLLMLAAFAILFGIYAIYRRKLYAWLKGEPDQSTQPRIGGGTAEPIGRLFDKCVSAALLALLGIILAWPTLLDALPRLWLLPLLLGVWTPPLGFVAAWSHRTRLPLIALLVAALFIVTHINGDNHTVDLIDQPPTARPSFKTALDQWKSANDCVDKPCPPPILVMITGGASRSAFFAGSTLGLLTDLTCEEPQADGCKQEPLFARRLFAISAVSGGSVGAAVYAQALVDGSAHGAGPFVQPCRTGRKSELYFNTSAADGWRKCLQTILAEDFLSPVMAGLGFRDVLSFVGGRFGDKHWLDRGRRIEAAIACAYRRYVFSKTDLCKTTIGEGLETPLSRPGLSGRNWSPILMLNSTDVESGKRFVFSTLAPEATEGGRWLQDGYDFHQEIEGHDITLVAAANNSARFPLISPAGEISAEKKGKIAASLVDGGYYENYGATTLYDLVRALKDEKLDPFLLLIANDPKQSNPAGWGLEPNGRPALPASARPWIPRLISAPIDAVLATREARGEGALVELQLRLWRREKSDEPPACGTPQGDQAPCLAFINVYPPSEDGSAGPSVKDRIEGLSMSWWLSKPIQKYLDGQLELPQASDAGEINQRKLECDGQVKNAEQLLRVCRALMGEQTTLRCEESVRRLAHSPTPFCEAHQAWLWPNGFPEGRQRADNP